MELEAPNEDPAYHKSKNDNADNEANRPAREPFDRAIAVRIAGTVVPDRGYDEVEGGRWGWRAYEW